MDRREILEDAIRVLARRAGVARPEFHVISVSQDSAGIFIMQTTWPEGQLICEAIAGAVAAFPKDHYTTCVALLPAIVDEIINAVEARESAGAASTAIAGTSSG
jgi:hypothetical protein